MHDSRTCGAKKVLCHAPASKILAGPCQTAYGKSCVLCCTHVTTWGIYTLIDIKGRNSVLIKVIRGTLDSWALFAHSEASHQPLRRQQK
jgi:hypothetical protein